MEKKAIVRAAMWVVTYCFILAAIVVKIDAVGVVLLHIANILTPLVIGAVLAFVLARPYDFFCHHLQKVFKGRWGSLLVKPLSIVFVYSILLGIFVGAIAFVVPQLSQSIVLFSSNISSYSNNMVKIAVDLSKLFGVSSENVVDTIDSLITNLPQLISQLVQGVAPRIVDITMSIFSMVFSFFIGIILSVYFLLDKERIGQQAVNILRAYTSIKMTSRLMHIGRVANRTYSLFINGQLTEMMILGLLCYAGMKILGFPYALLISVIIALTNIIPLVGPWVGAVLPIFILLMIDPMLALGFVVFLLILQQIESNLIYPRVVGGSIGLPAQWVLLAVIVGGGLFGIVGMLFAVPTASVFYQLLREDVHARIQGEGTIE